MTIVRFKSRGETRTIEIEQDEDGGDQVGDECNGEVDYTVSEKKLPQRRPARRPEQSNCRKH